MRKIYKREKKSILVFVMVNLGCQLGRTERQTGNWQNTPLCVSGKVLPELTGMWSANSECNWHHPTGWQRRGWGCLHTVLNSSSWSCLLLMSSPGDMGLQVLILSTSDSLRRPSALDWSYLTGPSCLEPSIFFCLLGATVFLDPLAYNHGLHRTT